MEAAAGALATVTCLALAYSTSPEKRAYHERPIEGSSSPSPSFCWRSGPRSADPSLASVVTLSVAKARHSFRIDVAVAGSAVRVFIQVNGGRVNARAPWALPVATFRAAPRPPQREPLNDALTPALVTGAFVQETNHANWNEIHPMLSICR